MMLSSIRVHRRPAWFFDRPVSDKFDFSNVKKVSTDMLNVILWCIHINKSDVLKQKLCKLIFVELMCLGICT